MNKNLGINELVDTCVDAIDVADALVETFADGFQWQDTATLLGISPKIAEIASDAKEALDELLDLTPEEAEEAANLIAVRAKLPEGPVEGILDEVREAMFLIVEIYAETERVLVLGKRVGAFGRRFKKAA
jgi:hypothetical protein